MSTRSREQVTSEDDLIYRIDQMAQQGNYFCRSHYRPRNKCNQSSRRKRRYSPRCGVSNNEVKRPANCQILDRKRLTRRLAIECTADLNRGARVVGQALDSNMPSSAATPSTERGA